MAQVMDYLKATNLKLGLLINFGASRVWIKRVVTGLWYSICVNLRLSSERSERAVTRVRTIDMHRPCVKFKQCFSGDKMKMGFHK